MLRILTLLTALVLPGCDGQNGGKVPPDGTDTSDGSDPEPATGEAMLVPRPGACISCHESEEMLKATVDEDTGTPVVDDGDS